MESVLGGSGQKRVVILPVQHNSLFIHRNNIFHINVRWRIFKGQHQSIALDVNKQWRARKRGSIFWNRPSRHLLTASPPLELNFAFAVNYNNLFQAFPCFLVVVHLRRQRAHHFIYLNEVRILSNESDLVLKLHYSLCFYASVPLKKQVSVPLGHLYFRSVQLYFRPVPIYI